VLLLLLEESHPQVIAGAWHFSAAGEYLPGVLRESSVGFIISVTFDELDFLNGFGVELLVLGLLLNFSEDLLIIRTVVRGEPTRLYWLYVLFKDLRDRALLLLLENVEEEHELVLPLLGQFHFFVESD